MAWEILIAMNLCWLFHNKAFRRTAPLTDESWNFLLKTRVVICWNFLWWHVAVRIILLVGIFRRNKLNLPFQRWLFVMNKGGTIFSRETHAMEKIFWKWLSLYISLLHDYTSENNIESFRLENFFLNLEIWFPNLLKNLPRENFNIFKSIFFNNVRLSDWHHQRKEKCIK